MPYAGEITPVQRRMLRALDAAGAHDARSARTPARLGTDTRQSPDGARATLRHLAHRGLADREQDGQGVWVYWLTTEGLAEARKDTAA